MEKKVISYVRVSTKEQLKGHSIEAQTEMLDNYAKYHLPKYEMERYKDKGKTATNMRRSGLKQALATISFFKLVSKLYRAY
ncbi:MAG: recombinase family protein [Bacilli bacterium]